MSEKQTKPEVGSRKKTWIVHRGGSTGGGPTTDLFDNINAAEVRACDLARRNPGVRYVVYEAVSSIMVPAAVLPEMERY